VDSSPLHTKGKDFMTSLEGAPLLQSEGHPVEVSSKRLPPQLRPKTPFPLNLPVRYRTLSRNSQRGEGRALIIASNGVVVASPHTLTEGAKLELSIEWPPLLRGKIPLRLITVGRVVQCGLHGFSVWFRGYEFRTVPRGLNQKTPL
jgi:hypothetical protein